MIGIAIILIGYCYLVATFGLQGLVAVGAHIILMALCTGKKDRS